MQLILDLGTGDDLDWLDAHLSERGIGVEDVIAAAAFIVPRRKGSRLFGYGRGAGGRHIVLVFNRTVAGWRPKTAWFMDEVEVRWWRKHGGR